MEITPLHTHNHLAEELVASLFDNPVAGAAGLDHALRVELLLRALDKTAPPRTVLDLLTALHRTAAPGHIYRELLLAVRSHAEQEPDQTLEDLVSRLRTAGRRHD